MTTRRRWRRSLMAALSALAMGAAMMTAAAPAHAEVVFSDDFEDGDASGWSKSGGSWSVVSDDSLVYRQSSTSSDAKAVTGDDWAGQSAEARVKPLDWGGSSAAFSGVLGRTQSMTNYYYLALTKDDEVVLGKRQSGSYTTLDSAPLDVALGSWYSLRLEAFGDELQGYLDGELVVSAIDGTFSSGGVGLATRYAGAAFDDVVVADEPGGGEPPPPDEEPPTMPGNLSVTGTTSSSVGLAWDASSDNDQVDRYDVYQVGSGTPVDATGGTSFTVTGLEPETDYQFFVVAVDRAGNESDPSNTVSATTDEGPPPPPPPEPGEADGWASINALGQDGTTGGAGGSTVTVDTATEFLDAIGQAGPLVVQVSGTIDLPAGMHDVTSDKTIVGLGDDATITGGGLNIGLPLDDDITSPPGNEVHNVIVQNLTFVGWDDDAINVQMFTHHVWIDHNTFLDTSADGSVDVKRGSDYVTVSWNHSTHDKNMLLGHDDDNAAQDVGRLRVTYHHNWFDGTQQRNPRVRFGDPVHVFNNYYLANEDYGIRAAIGSGVLVEGNYFEDVEDTFHIWEDGRIVAQDNCFDNSEPGQTSGSVGSIPYTYTLLTCDDVPAIVTAGAGAGNSSPPPPPDDTEPPSVPGNLQVTGVTSSSVGLAWDASTDNDQVSHYDVYQMGSPDQVVASAAGASATVTGLDPETGYAFYMVAVDRSGNESTPSSSVSATTDDVPDPPPPGEIVGWASVPALGLDGTTGGAGGQTITVTDGSTLADLLEEDEPLILLVDGMLTMPDDMNDVHSDKTIIGVGADSGIAGAGLNISSGYNNIIIRNLNFDDWADDAINVQNEAHHIWIDHNFFGSGGDGSVDVKRGSDYVTVSWNHTTHEKNMLLGHDDDNGGQDIGHLRVTYHHNWFDGSDERNPRVRFGNPVHVFNNYYTDNQGYGVAATMDSGVLVEGNYFENVPNPTVVGYADSGPGNLIEQNNVFVNSGTPETTGTGVNPIPYGYELDDPNDIPALVSGGAGPRSDL